MPPRLDPNTTSVSRREKLKMADEAKVDQTLDVRGEICPNPDVRTMTTLEKMEKGQILEVLVDYPLSVERIPKNAENRKHKVLKVQEPRPRYVGVNGVVTNSTWLKNKNA